MDIFKGIFDSAGQSVIDVWKFMLCLGVALLLGLGLAFAYIYKTKYTKSFFITLTLLPAVVCVVIMMVNGNIGAGVAVAGAFSLVRFRSAPGTAKEISALFLAMCTGIVLGMGYVAYAVLFAVILGLAMFATSAFRRKKKSFCADRTLVVTIPEDLNYTEVFDDILSKYTTAYELTKVKTSNLGSLYKLTYDITLKGDKTEKELIDELRTRNGNLEISVMRQANETNEL